MPAIPVRRINFKFRDKEVTYAITKENVPRYVVLFSTITDQILPPGRRHVGLEVARENKYLFRVAGVANGGVCSAMALTDFTPWLQKTLLGKIRYNDARLALCAAADLVEAIGHHSYTGKDWTRPAPTAVVRKSPEKRATVAPVPTATVPAPQSNVTEVPSAPAVEVPPRAPEPDLPALAAVEVGAVNYRNLFFCRVILASNGKVYVVLHDVAKGLGMDPGGFRQRIQRRFVDGQTCIMHVSSPTGVSSAFCLELECIPMAVATISPSHVSEERRPHLRDVQENLSKALADYEFRGNASNPSFSQTEREFARQQQDATIQAQLQQLRDSNAEMQKTIQSISTALAVLPLTIRSMLAPQAPTIDSSTHYATLRQERNGVYGSATKLMKHFNVPFRLVRTLLGNKGMIDDMQYGRWYDVTTGAHGNVKQNWDCHLSKCVQALELDIASYRKTYKDLRDVGLKERTAVSRAVYKTVQNTVLKGTGMYKYLQRFKPIQGMSAQ